jgi:hypothetical protein
MEGMCALSFCMPTRLLSLIALLCLSTAVYAQTETRAASAESPVRYQIYGGYSYLSNSLNGVTGSHHALNGWDAGAAFPAWHNLRFKIDFSSYSGTNLGTSQKPFFIVGGGQYDVHLKRETLFAEGMGGVGGANKIWGTNFGANTTGATASFTAVLGGGLDTRIARRLAVRLGGDYQYSYFSLNGINSVPYRIAGLPTNFGRAYGGMVWLF